MNYPKLNSHAPVSRTHLSANKHSSFSLAHLRCVQYAYLRGKSLFFFQNTYHNVTSKQTCWRPRRKRSCCGSWPMLGRRCGTAAGSRPRRGSSRRTRAKGWTATSPPRSPPPRALSAVRPPSNWNWVLGM